MRFEEKYSKFVEKYKKRILASVEDKKSDFRSRADLTFISNKPFSMIIQFSIFVIAAIAVHSFKTGEIVTGVLASLISILHFIFFLFVCDNYKYEIADYFFELSNMREEVIRNCVDWIKQEELYDIERQIKLEKEWMDRDPNRKGIALPELYSKKRAIEEFYKDVVYRIKQEYWWRYENKH